MSMQTPMNVQVASAPVATGSNALKALQAAGGTEAGSAASGTAVHFTLDDAGHTSDADNTATLSTRIARGTHSATGPAAHARGKSAASGEADTTDATDGTLMSMLQAISVAPVVVPAGSASTQAAAATTPAADANSNTTTSAIGNAVAATIAGLQTGSPVIAGASGALSLASSVLGALLPDTSGTITEDSAGHSGEAKASSAGVPLLSSTAPTTQTVITPAPAAAAAAQGDAANAALVTLPLPATPASPAVKAPAPAAPTTTSAATVSAAAIARLVDGTAVDLPPNVLQLQRQANQRAAANAGSTTVSSLAPGRAMAAGSSGLLAALAQTITDAATAVSGATSDLTPTAQAMNASFSSLLQQVTEGSARNEATSATLVQAAAPSDVQLANAVATASSPALAMVAAPADAGASTNAAVVSPSTAAPIDTSRQNWPDALGSRVEWMLHQGLQEARIELHPRDMGSINVHIKLGNDGADVRFAATNPNVRDALEASLPKLRELLAGSGLQLAQAQVGSQMQQQESSGRFLPQQAPAQSPSAASGNGAGTDVQPATDAPRVRVASLSIIDDYA